MFGTFRDSGYTATWGRLPPGELRVQQLQCPVLDRRRRRGEVEPPLLGPRGPYPVHREGSEMPEQAPECRTRPPPGTAEQARRETSQDAAPPRGCGAFAPFLNSTVTKESVSAPICLPSISTLSAGNYAYTGTGRPMYSALGPSGTRGLRMAIHCHAGRLKRRGMPMRPANMLVIMANQHNPKMLGCIGGEWIKTPNPDAPAARGTRFDNACANSPICVPARDGQEAGDADRR